MKTAESMFKSHALPFYFVLTFAVSWGGILVISGAAGGFPQTKEQFEHLLVFFILALLLGPSLAGFVGTAIAYGKAGFRDLFSRLLRWRMDARWYAVALLTAPLVLAAALLPLSQYSHVFLPGIVAKSSKTSLLSMGLVSGLVVGFFEEIGWTGFSTPRLRLRFGILGSGLIVGVLWGAWHIFLNALWASGAYAGELSPAVFVAARGFGDLVGLLPAYRVLMVWVYDRTGSLLLAMLMHASLTASTIIVEPPEISGGHLLIYDLACAVAMWMLVGAAAVVIRLLGRRGAVGPVG